MTGDAIAAMLLQLSGHAERLSVLDEREAGHFRVVQQRLSELADLIIALGGTLEDQSVVLARLEGLASPAAPADEDSPGGEADHAPSYEPLPAPRWWKLTGEARGEALDKLRGWVEQVYRPGYGQLAATLGACWDQHPLCLYGLDVLSELWSVLYLQAQRSPAVVSAQAEFQARIVPAIAEQLMAETTRCGHAQARPARQRQHPESAMTSRPDSQAMLAGALAYARRGWPVFPCRPSRKEPDTAHGFQDATTDPERIIAWWTAVPGRNVAIATGASGPDVLDVNVRPGGSGYPALDRLKRAGLLQGAVATVVTPSGGMHLYYCGTGQASGRLPGCYLDFKGAGGYVLAPPSAVGGRPYRLIRHQPGRTGQAAGGRLDWAAAVTLLEPRQPHPEPARPPSHTDTERLAAWVARLPEGNRNAGLFWAACRAAENGRPGVLDALTDAARTAGLPEREVTRTIASALRSTGRDRRVPSRRPYAEPRDEHDSEAVI